MLFKLYRTSRGVINPIDKFRPELDHKLIPEYYYNIDIDSLEDLIHFRSMYMEEVIIKDFQTIEIYDTFRE